MDKRQFISRMKSQEEIALMFRDIIFALSLIPILGWRDKITLKTIKSVKKLLAGYYSYGSDLMILQQEFMCKVFNELSKAGIDVVVKQLIIARENIRGSRSNRFEDLKNSIVPSEIIEKKRDDRAC